MAKAGLLFAGTDDGVVLFSNPGAVGRWLKIGQELRGLAVRAIWPLAENPLVLFAAVAGAGLQRSDDGGQSWRAALDADVSAVAGHPGAPELLYLAAAGDLVYRSEDVGASWARCALPAGAGGARLAVGHDDPRRLYLGGAGVWGSADGGSQWAPYGSGAPAAVDALAELPGQPGLLYALAAGALLRCAGPSAPWEPVAAAPAAGAALAALAGREPALLMATGQAGLARGADGGATWADVGPEPGWSGAVTVIAPAPYHMDTAFAGSAGGQLALSADRGRTWQLLRQDLPALRSIAAARLA